MGIKSSDGVKGTWDLLRSADMEDQSYFDLLEFIESRLPNNFLSLDYKPKNTTRYLQKKYGITPQEYKQIAENIDHKDPEIKKALRLGILYFLLTPDDYNIKAAAKSISKRGQKDDYDEGASDLFKAFINLIWWHP